MRPGAPIGQRPERGRRPGHTDQNKQTHAPNLEIEAQLDVPEITQPPYVGDGISPRASAAGAETGRIENFPPFHTPLNEDVQHVTGAPPIQPFMNQKQKQIVTARPTSSTPGLQPGTSSTPGLESGREPLPPEASGRLAPPVTKGAPQALETMHPPSTPAPSVAQPAGHHIALDHDYYRKSSPLEDHTYFRPQPQRPPPGFEHYRPEGRPKRNIKFPSKFDDYET